MTGLMQPRALLRVQAQHKGIPWLGLVWQRAGRPDMRAVKRSPCWNLTFSPLLFSSLFSSSLFSPPVLSPALYGICIEHYVYIYRRHVFKSVSYLFLALSFLLYPHLSLFPSMSRSCPLCLVLSDLLSVHSFSFQSVNLSLCVCLVPG